MTLKNGMSNMKKLLLLISVLLLCGCSPRASQVIRPSAVPDRVITKTAMPAAKKLPDIPEEDPWAVCAAAGNSGVTVSTAAELSPEEFLRRVQITFMIQEPELPNALTARRCMNGKLYACQIKDGTNCLEQIDLSAVPNQVMTRICEEVKDGILTDAAVPRNTAFAWGCQNGEPVIISQIREADAAGYDRTAWFEIPAP